MKVSCESATLIYSLDGTGHWWIIDELFYQMLIGNYKLSSQILLFVIRQRNLKLSEDGLGDYTNLLRRFDKERSIWELMDIGDFEKAR